MFENLTERLGNSLKAISGRGRLSENNIKDALRDVRLALLDADVALPVVRVLIDTIKERAIGQEVIGSLTPGQALIKVVRDELTTIMGEKCNELNLKARAPVVILMAGLQGSGKTTSVAKLARLLKERENKKVSVVSCDVYRPAAIEQLQTLALEVEADFIPSRPDQKPIDIAKAALNHAKIKQSDVLIVDTAGRLHIDVDMMAEIKALHQLLNPTETLFVVDSMTGQDAANTAKAFNDTLQLTGVILTKTDGDARGGAALSVRHITGKPIKFIGVGEKTTALEPFHPDRIASRIIGQGDLLSLIEQVERKVDKTKADKLAKKMVKGKSFDLEDFREQLNQMRSMGDLGDLMDKIPGMSQVPDKMKSMVDDKSLAQMEAIINSMTAQERRFPAVLKASRKLRIAKGSGNQVQDVNKLLKQFSQMQKMMKKVRRKGTMNNMMKGLQNKMPPGMMPF